MNHNSTCPHAGKHDEDIVSMIHAGKRMLCSLTITYDCEADEYVVRYDDKREIHRVKTRDEAIDHADGFLEGFLAGLRAVERDSTPEPHIHAFNWRQVRSMDFVRERRN